LRAAEIIARLFVRSEPKRRKTSARHRDLRGIALAFSQENWSTLESEVPTKEEIIEFLAREFPQNECVIETVEKGGATIIHHVDNDNLRPGGTVSGPLLMTVADIALYVAILGTIGIVPLTVTTSLTINFLRKPVANKAIIGKCKLIKVGRSLIVGEVGLHSSGSEAMVAHAVGTYSVPPGTTRL
jgi:acyl-coenzyme A thioesterase PaaI-like protein